MRADGGQVAVKCVSIGSVNIHLSDSRSANGTAQQPDTALTRASSWLGRAASVSRTLRVAALSEHEQNANDRRGRCVFLFADSSIDCSFGQHSSSGTESEQRNVGRFTLPFGFACFACGG
jgi:hypothetical protein